MAPTPRPAGCFGMPLPISTRPRWRRGQGPPTTHPVEDHAPGDGPDDKDTPVGDEDPPEDPAPI